MCEGLGMAFCGEPSLNVDGGLRMTMSNVKDERKTNAISLTVSETQCEAYIK